jgi:hypothetical protein
MKHLAIEVKNNFESEAVQQALFDMGFEWNDGSKELVDYGTPIRICIYYDDRTLCYSGNDFLSDPYYKTTYGTVSFSEFFSTYAGHIERFPDYVEEEKNLKMKLFAISLKKLSPNLIKDWKESRRCKKQTLSKIGRLLSLSIMKMSLIRYKKNY